MSDPTDWLAYLEADPHYEPYLSIARAWRIDRGNLSLAEEGLANYQQEVQRIRQESLTWAMACPHGCPACERLYDVIRGPEPTSGVEHRVDTPTTEKQR
jgi:hypothetical protein